LDSVEKVESHSCLTKTPDRISERWPREAVFLFMVFAAYGVAAVQQRTLRRTTRTDAGPRSLMWCGYAIMGFSRGGHAAFFASVTRFHKMWNKSGIAFAVYIPVYPDCATACISDTEVADSPIRIFGGTPDDYDPIAPRKAYVKRLKAAGRDVEVTECPHASHSFDDPHHSRRRGKSVR
jgi:hypothetical protein